MRLWGAKGKLNTLNLLRWARYRFLSWGSLLALYFLMLHLFLEPFMEKERRIMFMLTLGGLIGLAFLCNGTALLKGISRRGPSLFQKRLPAFEIIFKNELRQLSTWILFVLITLFGFLIPSEYPFFWAIACHGWVQKGAFQIPKWAKLCRYLYPTEESKNILPALAAVSLFLSTLSFLILMGLEAFSVKIWIVCMGSLLAACSTLMEGDLGKPILVNLISLTAGLIGGALCFYSPWIILIIAYLFERMIHLTEKRGLSTLNDKYETHIP